MAERIIRVGIDEAGYGPILGPLVVSASAFDVPGSLASVPLWDVLRASVSRVASVRAKGIPILDSKKLHSRKAGLGRLERSILAAVAAWRGHPGSLWELLSWICTDGREPLRAYPWYEEANLSLPRAADSGWIRIAGGLLQRDLASQSCRLAGLWCEVLPEGHYNRLVDSTNNKAVVLSGLTLRLIQRVADAHPGQELDITIDKQGARDHYAPMLMRAFEDRRLKVLEEGDEHSAYELIDARTRWRVSYHQGGESLHMPIALASLLSKYVREVLMECFNDYRLGHVPEVKPTAGYYQDGQRFLREISDSVRRLGISRDLLVRQR